MLLISAFSKENSAISLEEFVLVFTVFTTATRTLRVKLVADGLQKQFRGRRGKAILSETVWRRIVGVPKTLASLGPPSIASKTR